MAVWVTILGTAEVTVLVGSMVVYLKNSRRPMNLGWGKGEMNRKGQRE